MAEIVKAGPNTAKFPEHAYMYNEVVAWEKGVAAESAMVATTNRYKNYLSGPFKLWWTNYDAGRDEEPYPQIPEGFEAQMTEDGLGFDLVGSGAPCGPVPIYKKRVVAPSTPGLLPAGGIAGQANSVTYTEPFPGAKLYEPLTTLSGRVFQMIKDK